jgi:2-dehydro-3-deoxyphosphooctonate aldolase (KDO 8-P synthase)
VTHALQLPGGEGIRSGGQPQFIEPLARAGVAAGVNGVFMEVHDNPSRALSDGANALNLRQFKPLMARLRDLGNFVRKL